MTGENEHLIRRSHRETFGVKEAQYLGRLGTKGLIPLEMSLDDLKETALDRGLSLAAGFTSSDGVGNLVVGNELILVTIPTDRGDSFWLFDDDVEALKRLFGLSAS